MRLSLKGKYNGKQCILFGSVTVVFPELTENESVKGIHTILTSRDIPQTETTAIDCVFSLNGKDDQRYKCVRIVWLTEKTLYIIEIFHLSVAIYIHAFRILNYSNLMY